MPKRPSLLPPTKGSRRRSSNGPARPLRVEIVIALVTGLLFLVVPLYLFRKPAGIDGGAREVVAEADASLVLDIEPREIEVPTKLTLEGARILHCGNQRGSGTPSERCDRLPFFEEALAKAIVDNESCAPTSLEETSVNFVLSVDFGEEKLHLWPGQSGSLRRPRANELLRCVMRDLPSPDWASIQHQHRFYEVSVMATYRP